MKRFMIPNDNQHFIADPTLLDIKDSPDGKYHMFCHTMLGIEHYTSVDAENWVFQDNLVKSFFQTIKQKYYFKDSGVGLIPIFKYALRFLGSNSGSINSFVRSFIYKVDSEYFLYYQLEKFSWKNRMFRFPPNSSLFCIKSKDLLNWSEPTVVLEESDELPFVSSPSVIFEDDKFKLYFTYKTELTDNTSLHEPIQTAYATCDKPDGIFSDINLVTVYNGEDKCKQIGALRVRRFENQTIFTCNPIVKLPGDTFSDIHFVNKVSNDTFKIYKKLVNAEDYINNKISDSYVGDVLKLSEGKYRLFFNTRRVNPYFDKVTVTGSFFSTLIFVLKNALFAKEDLYYIDFDLT